MDSQITVVHTTYRPCLPNDAQVQETETEIRCFAFFLVLALSTIVLIMLILWLRWVLKADQIPNDISEMEKFMKTTDLRIREVAYSLSNNNARSKGFNNNPKSNDNGNTNEEQRLCDYRKDSFLHEQNDRNSFIQRPLGKPRKNFEQSNDLEKVVKMNSLVTKQHASSQASLQKSINVLNSMGRPFCQTFVLSSNNATVQLKNSTVKMILSLTDLSSNEITCHASSFRSVSENYKMLQLSRDENEAIASPAIEYILPGTKLKGFARIEMPCIGQFDDVHCWRVESDQGKSETPQKCKILNREKVDTSDPNLLSYYEKGSLGTIIIYTKSFSWFVCTTCNSEHDSFGLRAYIYGSLRTLPNGRQRVSIALYIADEVHRLEDYFQLVEDREKRRKRTLLVDRQIEIPTRVSLTDFVKVELTTMNDPRGYWKHMADSEASAPIYDIQKDIQMDRIIKCHLYGSSGLPCAKDWFLESHGHTEDAPFECLIKVECHAKQPEGQQDEVTYNPFLVENLTEVTETARLKKQSDNGHAHQPLMAQFAEHPLDAMVQPFSANPNWPVNAMPQNQPIHDSTNNHLHGGCVRVLDVARGEIGQSPSF